MGKIREHTAKIIDRYVSGFASRSPLHILACSQPTSSIKAILFYHEACKVNLEQHFKFFSKNYDTETLCDLISSESDVGVPKIAVTFDDGHADNHSIAFDLAKKYKVPITIFLTTQNIGEPLWTAELKNHNVDVEPYKQTTAGKIRNKIQSLRQTTGATPTSYVGRRILNKEEIRRMAESKYVNFENHTHNHLGLTHISTKNIKYEIEKGNSIVNEITGETPDFLCYPFGKYNDKVIDVVESIGLTGAVTVEPGLLRAKQRYSLPRINAQRSIDEISTCINLLSLMNYSLN